MVFLVPLNHRIQVALELDIGLAGSCRIVLAREASGQILEDLIVAEVGDGAYPILRRAPFVEGVSAGLIHVGGQDTRPLSLSR